MPHQNHLVIAAPQRWDEACFSVPTIRALEKSKLLSAILCREEQQYFWTSVSNASVITYSQKSNPSHIASQLTGIFESSIAWDDAIPATAFAKARITNRIGPEDSPLRKFFTQPIKIRERPTEHRILFYINSAKHFGIEVNLPEFFMPASIGIPALSDTILLSPGSDFGPSHEWPLNQWIELTEQLLEQNKIITVACSIGKEDLGKNLTNRFGTQINSFHASPLHTSIPTIAANRIVIASDSSLPHLAAYTGSSCITLFGPNNPSWKRPIGKQNIVAKQHAECSPCLSPKCLMDHRCLTQLSPSKILSLLPNTH